jgi:hypothetical protein
MNDRYFRSETTQVTGEGLTAWIDDREIWAVQSAAAAMTRSRG